MSIRRPCGRECVWTPGSSLTQKVLQGCSVMESHSPILWIQFAQSHCHLSENKWEAEGRTGWKERHVAGQWENSRRVKQTYRRMSWRKIPTSNWTKRLAEQAWDKSNSLPQEVENYSSTEQLLKGGEREQEKGWKERGRGELSDRERQKERKEERKKKEKEIRAHGNELG